MQAKLFERTLNIEPPFFIKDIQSDAEEMRLDIVSVQQVWDVLK